MSRTTKPEIDHSRGHAFLHNGDIYYSPNSSRPISVSMRTSGSRYRFNTKEAYWERFCQPEWWTAAYCFLSFVPLRPSFEGESFGSLRDIVPYIKPDRQGHFQLDADKAADWIQLQDSLIYVAVLLTKKQLVLPALNPIPPSFLGFLK